MSRMPCVFVSVLVFARSGHQHQQQHIHRKSLLFFKAKKSLKISYEKSGFFSNSIKYEYKISGVEGRANMYK